MRSAVGELSGSNPSAEVTSAITAFTAKLVSAGGNGGGGGRGAGGGGGRGGTAGGPPPAPNFAGLIAVMNRQMEGDEYGDLAPNEPMMKAWSWACADLKTAVNNWRSLNTADLVEFNKVVTKNGMKAVAAAPALAVPVCSVGGAAKH